MNLDFNRRYFKVFAFAVISLLLVTLVIHSPTNTVNIKKKIEIFDDTLNGYSNCSMKRGTPYPRRAAILSVSLHKRYLFTLPFSVAGWKKLGVEPIVIIVGDRDVLRKQHQSKVTIDLLRELEATIHFIQNKTLAAPTLSQTSRLFAAAMPFSQEYAEDNIFITSDADVVPFHLANHVPNLAANQKLYIFNAGCYGRVKVPPRRGSFTVQQFSMSTLGATVAAWRDIMGFNVTNFTGLDIESYLKMEFGTDFFHPTDGENRKLKRELLWYTDQSLVSYKIREWFKKNPANEYATTKNRFCARRIDRARWPKSRAMSKKNLLDWDDAHVIEWGYKNGQWQRFKPFVDLVFKGKEYKSLRARFYKYRKDYIAKDCC